jgi:hypothetical protein
VRPLLLLVALSGTGCSLMLGDGFVGGGPADANADPDGGVTDADVASPVDAGADGDAGYENVAPNPGFEDDGVNCGGGWGPNGATLTSEPIGRSGARSCRVCSSQPATYFTIDPLGFGLLDVLPGEVYRAEAWVRRVAPTPPPSEGVAVYQRVYRGGTQVESSSSDRVVVGDDWGLVGGLHEVTQAGRLELYFEARPATGVECFLIDDVVLMRVK